jgi:hypothetical protein
MNDAATEGSLLDALTPDQRSLWAQVEALWSMAMRKDADAIRAALHPRYAGWDMNASAPHDREAAVESVTGDGARILSFTLRPMRVEVYEGTTGVAHYTYTAVVGSAATGEQFVHGRWTEVYVRRDGEWLMVAVNGGPQAAEEDQRRRSE